MEGSYAKIEKLAKTFDAVYPQELSARLGWWRQVLGIDRARFLRLLGMSAQQAARRKGEDFKELLKNAEWEQNARSVEESLQRLLSLFHYDWHALAAQIHGAEAGAKAPNSPRDSHRREEADRMRSTSNGDSSGHLIDRIREGGPQSFSALMSYLAGSQGRGG